MNWICIADVPCQFSMHADKPVGKNTTSWVVLFDHDEFLIAFVWNGYKWWALQTILYKAGSDENALYTFWLLKSFYIEFISECLHVFCSSVYNTNLAIM